MRDLKIGFDAIDIFRPNQIQRTVLRYQAGRQFRAGKRRIACGQPATGDLGACDCHTPAGRIIALSPQHDVQCHRQARRADVIGRLGRVCPRQTVDQPHFTAIRFGEVCAVHPVDDAGQHETRIAGVKQRAIEQLKVVRTSGADGFVREIGFMPEDVSFEFVVEHLADWSHQRQREQLVVGKRRFARSHWQDNPAQRESSEVEFPQCQGIGDRSAALERRRALRIAHRQKGREQDENGNKKSHARSIS